ncbi:MAG TPA: lysine--tRNA ligase, partial [Anaeromyxobacter sp.]
IARDPGRWSIAGRVLANRAFGKAAFLKISDRAGELQIWVKKDRVGDAAFEVYKLLDVGDIVAAEGPATRTKTGELTLEAASFTILTKAMRPLPEKWHGLTDVEQRYRQRYVDLVVTPGVREVFRKRTQIVSTIRRFLDARGYLEVETPTLHKPEEAGGAAARPFETFHNALEMPLKLRIATELHLKRLVVGGLDRVYEIGRIFRNEGISRRHNPEFTSIEFYQAYATHEDLMKLTEELFHALALEVAGSPAITFQGQRIDLTPPYPRVSLVGEGAKALGLSVEEALAGRGLAEALARAAARENESEDAWKLEQAATRSPGEAIAAAFEVFGEGQLPKDRPAFVVDWPFETSPLSRRRDSDPRLVDRFELFAGGMEVANAFSELNDPNDQRARFEAQTKAKAAGDEEAMPYDEDFVRALEHGMPPTAGEGIGIDRVTMLLTDSPSIRDVILFPLLKTRG